MTAVNVMLLLVVVAAASARMCPGCPYEQDPNSFDAAPLRRALAASGNNDVVTKIISVTSQVVAGIKYHVVYEVASGKTCEATWIDAPWVNSNAMDFQVSCRAKRSLVGGFQDVAASEMDQIKSYGEAVANEGNTGNWKVVVEVLKAQKQIVHGTIYKINYIVKTSACKPDELTNEVCLNNEVGPREVCEATFFVSLESYFGHHQIQTKSVQCHQLASSFLAVLGGFQDVDASEMPDVQKMTEVAASSQFNGMRKSRVDIMSAQRQVVNGFNYKVRFMIRTTACPMDKEVDANDKCMFTETGLRKICETTFYSSPYTVHDVTKFEVKSLQCKTMWL